MYVCGRACGCVCITFLKTGVYVRTSAFTSEKLLSMCLELFTLRRTSGFGRVCVVPSRLTFA